MGYFSIFRVPISGCSVHFGENFDSNRNLLFYKLSPHKISSKSGYRSDSTRRLQSERTWSDLLSQSEAGEAKSEAARLSEATRLTPGVFCGVFYLFKRAAAVSASSFSLHRGGVSHSKKGGEAAASTRPRPPTSLHRSCRGG